MLAACRGCLIIRKSISVIFINLGGAQLGVHHAFLQAVFMLDFELVHTFPGPGNSGIVDADFGGGWGQSDGMRFFMSGSPYTAQKNPSLWALGGGTAHYR